MSVRLTSLVCMAASITASASAAPPYYAADTRTFFLDSADLHRATIVRPTSATGVFKTLTECQSAASRVVQTFQAEAALFGAAHAGTDISCSPVAAVDTGVPGSYLMVDQWNTAKGDYTYSRTAPVIDNPTCQFKNLANGGRAVWLFSDNALADPPNGSQITTTANYVTYTVPQPDGSSDIVFIGCT